MANELTDIKYVGDKTAKALIEKGYDTIGKVAIASPYDMVEIEGVHLSKAFSIRESAVDVLSEDSENLQYDPVEKEFYDAGHDVYYCACGKHFQSKTDKTVHQNRCSEGQDILEQQKPKQCVHCDNEAFSGTLNKDEDGIEYFDPICKRCFQGKFAHIFAKDESDQDSSE